MYALLLLIYSIACLKHPLRIIRAKKYGKLPLTQVARHGRGFPTPDTSQIAIEIIISVKNNVFLYWQLFIILFADDRAKKKYGITPLSASGKEKYISGPAARYGPGFHTQQIIVHFNDHR